ncbi:MAG: flagellar biosynthesis anti-sigma factor FlgM [Alteromonadaceae bacterium]|nr:flagellar biosynthesis anti-sigma factor FlgM [Alteromonadaceae bacterium]|tara:strand:+ start:262 stop:582 length:321 start_codon:yes stop_codon:yes gene_type:complete
MPVNFNGVNNNSVSPQRPGTTERSSDAASASRTDTASSPAASARDSVSLSARAEAMKQAEQQLRDQPEIDDARVAEIRQALADGTYKVDAEKLAQKMLEMDKGIFG